MNIPEFRKLVRGLSELDITFDEPHVTLRCDENNILKENIIRVLLSESSVLIRIVEDRPHVYKLYFQLGKKTELKIVMDTFTYGKINVRTVKKLSYKFRIGAIRERRF